MGGNRATDAAQALAVTFRRPALARAELAFGATRLTEAAFTVGIGLVAFADGGAAAVGILTAALLLPSALLAPVAGALGDRFPRDRLLVVSSGITAVALTGSALVLGVGRPTVLAYGLAVVAKVAATPYRAAHSALLPGLCATSEELTASNIVRTQVESVATVVGPLLAAGLAALADAWTIILAAAVASAVATVLVFRLPYLRPPKLVEERPPLLGSVGAGLRAAFAGDTRTFVLLASAQTFLRGALGVFVVVLAIETLERGEAAAGILQAALGIGCVAGAVAASRLIGSRHLAAWFGVAVVAWGMPVSLVGARPAYWWALAMLFAVGVANAVLDVAVFTTVGRLVPDDVLARVFGVFESIVAGTVAIGGVLAAAVVEGAGIETAMLVLGTVPPVAAVLGWRRLRRVDDTLAVRQRELEVLRRVPMLRALPMVTLDHLARRLEAVRLPAGTAVVTEGGAGDRYYVVAGGAVTVRRGGRTVGALGAGEGFGELALLEDAPRTATVVTSAPTELYVLDRTDFVAAVTGFAPAADEAAAVVARFRAPAQRRARPLRAPGAGPAGPETSRPSPAARR